jgi:hypothetical protein
MSADYSKALAHAQLLVRDIRDENGGKLTTDMIIEQVELILSMRPTWRENIDKDMLVRELESMFNTWIGEARTLEDPDLKHDPWIDKKSAEIKWRYWNRYKLYLLSRGLAEVTVNKLDEITNDTLNRLEYPRKQGAWDIRGMVVGHVQSGKTSNYTGLICKAVDAGYQLIIVLAGMHNNLRAQTQMRLDEGFLGYDSTRNLTKNGSVPAIGVGKIDPSLPRPDTITTRLENGDFNTTVAKHFNINPGGKPLLFVIKKNASVLKNLLEWIEWATNVSDENGRRYVSGVPLLVIDDEADNGSVNTKEVILDENGVPDPEYDPTVLNGCIRRILHSFDQSAYVGYTATPFANIFIHEMARTNLHGEDLFPRSFITVIPTPSNYYGPLQIFGINGDEDEESCAGLPITRLVRDHAVTLDPREKNGWMPPKHKSDHIPVYNGYNMVPPSLRKAIYSFILSCAGRLARGQNNVHNSMLVHVTRYIDTQVRVFEQVSEELARIQKRLHRGEGGVEETTINELKEIWNNDYIPTTKEINKPECNVILWEEVSQFLDKAASAIRVMRISGKSTDILDYIEHQNVGLSVIAIGGDKLSRGLTLEGLTVSYFLRASKMYDTLMQMGRWFGYRPGYIDLCRLYTSPDILEWFNHITIANEELRREFEHMCALKQSPRNFGLRVRSHPSLLVTAQVKMRSGTPVELSYSGDISETISFYRNEEKIRNNFEATTNLITSINSLGITAEQNPERIRTNGNVKKWNNCICWSDVPVNLIRRFLYEYKTHPAAHRVNCNLLSEYIEKQVPDGNLLNWTVFIPSGDGHESNHFPFGKMNLIKRAWHPPLSNEEPIITDRYSIRRLVSNVDETIDINSELYSKALKKTIDAWTINRGRSKRELPPDEPSGVFIREVRPSSKGVLIIYPLDPEGKSEKGAEGFPIIGFAISFPQIEGDKKVTYIVNNIYYEQEIAQEE